MDLTPNLNPLHAVCRNLKIIDPILNLFSDNLKHFTLLIQKCLHAVSISEPIVNRSWGPNYLIVFSILEP